VEPPFPDKPHREPVRDVEPPFPDKPPTDQEIEEAKRPLKLFLGGEVDGIWAAWFRLLPQATLREIKPDDTGSEFDKADRSPWDSKFAVNKIALAPGANMDISLENHTDGINATVYGQHTAWSWTITLYQPPGANLYRGVSFDVLVDGKVKKLGSRAREPHRFVESHRLYLCLRKSER